MDPQIDTAQRRVEATAIQLCEKWFEAGARASWCPAMANDFAQALQQARRDVLEEAVKVVNDYNLSHDHGKKATKACDDIAEMLDRLREGVK